MKLAVVIDLTQATGQDDADIPGLYVKSAAVEIETRDGMRPIAHFPFVLTDEHGSPVGFPTIYELIGALGAIQESRDRLGTVR